MNTFDLDKLARKEFPSMMDNLIYPEEDGSYSVFGKYKIVPKDYGYSVYCSATEAGTFSSTKIALSWCIADKYKNYIMARNIWSLDLKLSHIKQDISARASAAYRSKNPGFRELVETKLETKILHKKTLESELSKCVKWAKYYQQKGFQNETIRTGRI